VQTFVTPLSKSIIDETNEQFIGLYNGELTPKAYVKQQVEDSDAIIHIGPLPSDSNTGGWTQKLPTEHTIYMGHNRIIIGGKKWKGIHFVPILKKLISRIQTSGIQFTPTITTIVCLSCFQFFSI
jgi:pyruvate decarboxylase